MSHPLERIPFHRESWVAVNPYAMVRGAVQTLTLDGDSDADYTPEHHIAYVDKWEDDPDVPWAAGPFYCIKVNKPQVPDHVSTLLEALNARGRGTWLRVVREAVSEHTLLLWDQDGGLLQDGPHQCACGLGTIFDIDAVRCESGASIQEAT